jgi:gluconate kinase
MPTAIQGAIQSMCTDAVGQAVRALSEKYSFDLNEAMRELNLDKFEIKATTNASRKKKTETTDKPKTKRGTTGYLLYTGNLRKKVTDEMAQHLADGEKLKPSQVVTELAGRWKALSDDEKAEWNEKANVKNATESDGESVAPSSDDEAVKETKKVEKKVTKKATESDGESVAPSSDDEAVKETKKVEKKVTKKVEKKETKKVEKKETNNASDANTTTAPANKKHSGYIMFCNSIRAEVKAKLEAELAEGDKLKPADTMSQLAKRWKALSEKEKAEWNDATKTPENSDSDSD